MTRPGPAFFFSSSSSSLPGAGWPAADPAMRAAEPGPERLSCPRPGPPGPPGAGGLRLGDVTDTHPLAACAGIAESLDHLGRQLHRGVAVWLSSCAEWLRTGGPSTLGRPLCTARSAGALAARWRRRSGSGPARRDELWRCNLRWSVQNRWPARRRRTGRHDVRRNGSRGLSGRCGRPGSRLRRLGRWTDRLGGRCRRSARRD